MTTLRRLTHEFGFVSMMLSQPLGSERHHRGIGEFRTRPYGARLPGSALIGHNPRAAYKAGRFRNRIFMNHADLARLRPMMPVEALAQVVGDEWDAGNGQLDLEQMTFEWACH